MKNSLVVQGIQFQGYCGVTLEERRQAQPLMVDVELECSYEQAIITDSITHTVDYATVAARIVELGSGEAFALIETLADRMSQTLFDEFPITALELWVRKLSPQLPHVQGSVGVRLTRHCGDRRCLDQSLQFCPATFLTEQLARLPKGDVLDVATGYGRNAFYLAEHGFTVEGIDRDEEALASIASTAQQRNLTNLTVRTVDLEANPQAPPDLGKERYDIILVFFYLFRPIFPALLQALKPGGVLLYETFLIDNHRRYQHPRRSEFCLAYNELLHLIPEYRVLHYDEGKHEGPKAEEPTFTARLMAQKPSPVSSGYGSN